MGAVCCAERIVHEDVTIRGQPLGEGWVVALLTGVESNVLKQEEFARSQAANGVVGTNTERIASRWNIDANELGESLRCGSKAQPVYHSAIWSAKVRHDHHRCAPVKERLDGWHSGANARVVDDLPIRERHVEVNAQQHALPLHVQFANGAFP
jgi:hypothetical protein